MRVSNTTRDTVVAGRVTSGDSFWAKFRGLMGRDALDPDEGLWLPDTSSIHMFFMRFPIDCLFLGSEDADGTRAVVGLRHALPPWRGVVWYVGGAKGVVELPPGALRRSATAVGDRVRFEDVPAGA
jgi:uncharacterized membrane protein (UPF0127 family)